MKSFSRRSSKILGFTFLTSPTKPISLPSESFLSTLRRPPSLPEMPTALTPREFTMFTRRLLTLFKTISAISIVGSSVFLSPFTNSDSIPTFPVHLLISLPPPWTMIGLNPTSFKRGTSCITLFFSSSSIMALPPYFTTMIFRLNF